MKRLVDTHLHLSPKVSLDASVAASSLASDLEKSNVQRAVVLHLLDQPWSAEEFAQAIATKKILRGFVNIDPFSENAQLQLRNSVESLGFIGLKLHPRLQRFDLDDPAVHRLVGYAGEMDVPVLIDAFPDGDWLMMGFDPLAFARLARSCSQSRIIIGHFGGHHCIDFMMLAKRLPNIWFDLSYSLLYYAGSPVVDCLLYCCKSLGFRRVFFGSDYPDRPIDVTVESSLRAFERYGIEGENLENILWRNAAEFFRWSDL